MNKEGMNMMRHGVMSSACAVLTLACSALAGPGVRYDYNPMSITNIGSSSWKNTDLTPYQGPQGAPPAGTYVSMRVHASLGLSTFLPASTGFALSDASMSGGSSVYPTFAVGAMGYYANASQPRTAIAPAEWSSYDAYVFNAALLMPYSGGAAPLVLAARNSTASFELLNVRLSLFQEATPDFTGTLTNANQDGTLLRPSTYEGVGTPTAGSSPSSFRVQPFTVSVSGVYLVSMINNITNVNGTFTNQGAYGLLYQGSFDPANPTVNLVRNTYTVWGTGTQPAVGGALRNGLNGPGAEFQTGGVPGIALSAGTTYYYVVAANGYALGPVNGEYKIFFEGPGTVQAPATAVQCCRGTTCTVQQDCTGSVAGSASVVMTSCGAGNAMASCCFADYNHDGSASIDDLFGYLSAYFTGSPYANVAGDGVAAPVIDDLFLFIGAYFAGCA